MRTLSDIVLNVVLFCGVGYQQNFALMT